MTLDEMQALARRITYREGWFLRVTVPPYSNGGEISLTWRGPVVNALDGHAHVKTVMEHSTNISPLFPDGEPINPDTFVRAAVTAAMMVEIHEAREFFKVDGKRVFDPHVSPRTENPSCDMADPHHIRFDNYLP